MKNTIAPVIISTLTALILITPAVFSTSNRSIIVSDTSNNRIQILDFETGNHILSFGSKGSAAGQFLYPASSCVSPDGRFLYVADTGNNRIQKFDLSGSFYLSWGETAGGKSNGQFYSPSNITAGLTGGEERVFVADTGNNRIQVFNSNGVFIAAWGSTKAGSGINDFNNPQGLAMDMARGFLYIADTFNHRIKKYSLDGAFIAAFGGYGTEDGKMNYPKDAAIGPDGSIYVSDSLNYRIQKFSSENTFLTKWGSKGSDAAMFNGMFEISVDRDNSVYIADAGNHRLQKFSGEGAFIGIFGGTKSNAPGSFNYPEGVFIDEDSASEPVITLTETFTETPTETYTETFTETPTETYTETFTETPTETYTETFTETPTETYTETFTETPTETYTETFTETPTDTYTETFTETPTETFTPENCSLRITLEFDSNNHRRHRISASADTTMDHEGNIYVTDAFNHTVNKFTTNGIYTLSFDSYISEPAGLQARGDRVYVIDRAGCKVLIYSQNGRLLNSFGRKGRETGRFLMPSHLAIDENGSVYVSDTLNNRVQKFTADGNFIMTFGSDSACKNNSLLLPGGIAVMPDQSIAVMDRGGLRLVLFNSNGTMLRQAAEIKNRHARGLISGCFKEDSDLTSTSDGTLYAIGQSENKLVKISTGGNMLWQDAEVDIRNLSGIGSDSSGRLCVSGSGRSGQITILETACEKPNSMQVLEIAKNNPTPEVKAILEDLDKNSVFNYPNPFNSSTTLRFGLAGPKDVMVMITDSQGRLVWHRSLSAAETHGGTNTLEWRGANDNGAAVSNGVYIMKVSAGTKTISKKIALLK